MAYNQQWHKLHGNMYKYNNLKKRYIYIYIRNNDNEMFHVHRCYKNVSQLHRLMRGRVTESQHATNVHMRTSTCIEHVPPDTTEIPHSMEEQQRKHIEHSKQFVPPKWKGPCRTGSCKESAKWFSAGIINCLDWNRLEIFRTPSQDVWATSSASSSRWLMRGCWIVSPKIHDWGNIPGNLRLG